MIDRRYLPLIGLRVLDLFCCQGGASLGYALAGLEPVGVDRAPQPHYPFTFHQGDALEYAATYGRGFDLIHASPPCQMYTRAQKIRGRRHPDLVGRTREVLAGLGVPYVIENVAGAPLRDSTVLCGAMFGLRTYRHRLFETSFPVAAPRHPVHVRPTSKMGRAPVPGHNMHIVGNFVGVEDGRWAMGMHWTTREGLREAIPPAYARHMGAAFLLWRAERDGGPG
ncbi:SAM-dependent methyltransferase [Streptomyces sp. NPDC049879]|uniref:SAM-dependent methyltransferase n=1 Tax=Streptomyces sp. NPDC049879 TaxID=3365598 RepID=UPI0037A7658D